MKISVLCESKWVEIKKLKSVVFKHRFDVDNYILNYSTPDQIENERLFWFWWYFIKRGVLVAKEVDYNRVEYASVICSERV